jgi:hypothetical protein
MVAGEGGCPRVGVVCQKEAVVSVLMVVVQVLEELVMVEAKVY